MVVLKNITNEQYKKELKKMIIDHYQEIYGEEFKPISNNKLLDLIDKTNNSEEFFKELERHDN